MARVLATATAVPPFRLEREDFKRRCARFFRRHARIVERLVDNTRIDGRHLCRPPDAVVHRRSLAETSAEYASTMRALCEEVARHALDRAHLATRDVDLIVTTSCTGVMIPSVDAYLVESMALRRDVVRLPLTELGCAGGAAALARAREHLVAYPDRVALVIACELPSLTFQTGDRSMTNLVATAIFGDGAAAVVLGPPARARRPSVRLLDSRTHLFPRSQHLMGFDLKDGGFHIVLNRDVPRALRGQVRPLVESLLAAHGLRLSDVRFTVIHPGGRRLLEDLDRDLGIGGLTEPSWEVMRRYGNLSSATVLFVLDELGRRAPPPTGTHGVLAAFGPGFSCELSLLRWEA
jgi:alkylresorcinol/alkylpyrone synthase